MADFVHHDRLLEIRGDIARVRARGVALGELAWIVGPDRESRLAQVIELADAERSAVVRSKIAKRRHERTKGVSA